MITRSKELVVHGAENMEGKHSKNVAIHVGRNRVFKVASPTQVASKMFQSSFLDYLILNQV